MVLPCYTGLAKASLELCVVEINTDGHVVLDHLVESVIADMCKTLMKNGTWGALNLGHHDLLGLRDGFPIEVCHITKVGRSEDNFLLLLEGPSLVVQDGTDPMVVTKWIY